MLKKLWNDEAGVIALEYLLVSTILGLGLIVGMVAVQKSLVTEFSELGQAITSLSQEYSFSGNTWGTCAFTEGSATTDAPEGIDVVSTAATAFDINDPVCNP